AIACRQSGLLRGEGSALSRPLEAQCAGARPAHDIAFHIGNRDCGVVERGLDVRDTGGHDLLLFFFFFPLLWFASHMFSVLVLALCLGRSLSANRDRAAPGSLARTGICVRPLAARGQPTTVTQTSIRADFHQPFDIERDLLAQVAFDSVLLFNDLA